MDKTTLEPLEFIREPEPKYLVAGIVLGAVLGAITGALLYRQQQVAVSNTLSQVNYSVMERYHPEAA